MVSKILLVDDDFEVTASIEEILTRNGYLVDSTNSVEDAESMLTGFTYDLIVLDWIMPGTHGIDFLARIRNRGLNTPVLMLTGMDKVDNKVRGLESGADDYLTKPFSRQELLARVKAILRRPQTVETDTLSISGVTVDVPKASVTWQGKELKLTRQEFQLLEFLMRNKNQVFSQESLIQRLWSSLSDTSPDAVRTHMSRLRKKFETGGECPVQTVHGRGYVFVAKEGS